MPEFVRYFIKTGIAYFLLALLIGVILVIHPFVELPGFLGALFPTYLHVFTVGWITQLIFGVSIWMFPAPERGGRYGNETVVWSIYWTLNVGLALRIIGEPGKAYLSTSLLMNWLLLLSAVLQWVSGILYAYHIWGRIKGK
jgi:hypothetical protein